LATRVYNIFRSLLTSTRSEEELSEKTLSVEKLLIFVAFLKGFGKKKKYISMSGLKIFLKQVSKHVPFRVVAAEARFTTNGENVARNSKSTLESTTFLEVSLTSTRAAHESEVVKLSDLVLHDGGAVPQLGAVVLVVAGPEGDQGPILDVT
jgi:hypothetical protein